MSSKSILDMISERQNAYRDMTPEQKERHDLEKSMKRAPVSADDWQEFKRKFVEEYGGGKVKDDGMTHKEFVQYLKDGTREGESSESVALRDFLKGLDKI